MERLVTVEFGPSCSKRFGRAVAEAQSGAGECSEVEPGRYRTRFVLGEESAAYTGLARLLERVRHWRATEVYEDKEPVSVFHAKEMAWCASFELQAFRGCRFHFGYGVLPRCSVCPLFDAERAIRDNHGREPAGGRRRDHPWPQASRAACGGTPARPRPSFGGPRLPTRRMGRACL
jgi:hypothetical protein